MDFEEVSDLFKFATAHKNYAARLAREYKSSIFDVNGKKILQAKGMPIREYDGTPNPVVRKLLGSLTKHEVAEQAFSMGIAYGAALCAIHHEDEGD